MGPGGADRLVALWGDLITPKPSPLALQASVGSVLAASAWGLVAVGLLLALHQAGWPMPTLLRCLAWSGGVVLVVVVYCRHWFMRRLGGFTGDTFGCQSAVGRSGLLAGLAGRGASGDVGALVIRVWRHPRPLQVAGRCVGQWDAPVDARKAKRLAHRIRQVARQLGLPRIILTHLCNAAPRSDGTCAVGAGGMWWTPPCAKRALAPGMGNSGLRSLLGSRCLGR